MSAFIKITNGLANQWVGAMWPIIWQSAVLAGVIYLLTLCLRRLPATVRFWLWMLVPLRLLMMPLITVSLPLLPAPTQLEAANIEPVSAEMVITEPPLVRGIEIPPLAEEFEQVSTASEKEYLVSTRDWPNVWVLLMWAWMVGVAFWSIRLIRGLCRIRYIKSSAVEVSEDKVLALTQQAATMLGLKRIPKILVTEESVSPFLFGVLQPVLVIPAGLVSKVSDEALLAVCAHEFAHLRRRDPLVGWILAICEVIYFFHPVVYFVKHRILFERESACDDWVIATSKARRSIYANALISAADVCRTFSAKMGPVGVVAESFGELKKRLVAIGSNLKPRTRLSMTALVLLVIIGVICMPGIILTARPMTSAEGKAAKAFIGVTPSETIDPMTLPSGLSSSRAWHILRQWNVGPLLLGLTQRLGKMTDSSQRDDMVWTGVADGGRLQLNIAVEGDTSGEIFIGFFENPTWSAEPVQVRSFPRAGQYTINSLPPGKFQIGAMIGKLPVAAALGVHRTWPEPVEIKAGVTTVIDVLVSKDFCLYASGWYNQEVSRGFVGDWRYIDTDNLLQGRVIGPAGQPISFATVQVREHNPGARSIGAPNCGTSEQGFYKCDRIAWPYRVGVIWYEPIPSVFGYRHQYLMYNRVFEDSQTVDFKFDSFPQGDAKLKGRVLDQNGNPLKEFFIDVRTRINWDVMKNLDGKLYKISGYHVPFVSDDGTFELVGLPNGDVRARVIPFQILAYESHRDEEIVLLAGKTSNVEFRINAKDLLFGRVLFEDGSPAVIKPAPWPGAKTSIIMSISMGRGRRAHSVADVDDDGYFTVHFNEMEIEQFRSGKSSLIINMPMEERGRRRSVGRFPFELLGRDKNQAGVLKIEHPMVEPPSIEDEPLPKFEGIDVEFSTEQVKNKTLLVCFWDMEQRPSRNLVGELAKRADELQKKEVIVILVHTSDVDTDKLKYWLANRKIPFTCGSIKNDTEKVLFRWGVRAQPWLVLIDEKGVVRTGGFELEQLDEKLQESRSAKPSRKGESMKSDRIVLKLIDSDGRPVAGAKVGTNVRTSDVTVLGSKLSWNLRGREHNISNEWGEITLTREKLFSPSWPADRKLALYVLHEDRKIGATCMISKDGEREEINLTLEPVCLVHGKLDSEGLKKIGRPLTWTNVYLYWDRDSHGVLSHMPDNKRFEFLVPPGRYTLYAYGSGEGSRTKHLDPEIEVKANQSELDLGIIDLPPTKLSTLIGKQAIEFGPIKAWKNGPPVKLADLKGKAVIIYFDGDSPNTSRDLPRFVDLHDQFADKGLVIIALYNCTDMKYLENKWVEIYERFGGVTDVPFRVAIDGGEPTFYEGTDKERLGATYGAYNITSDPTTILIDPDGKVIGSLNLYKAKEILEKMLGVKPVLSTWRQRFNRVYFLEEGQVLKRIAPPFIPERKEYYKQEESSQASHIERPPDYFTFHWDGELKKWGLGFGSGKRPLKRILNSNLSMNQNSYEGPEELLEIDVPGDWIVRKDASEEQKLKALEEILAKEIGRYIRFEKRTTEREAIVATGSFKYHRLPVVQDDRWIHMFSDDFTPDGGGGGGTADSVSEFLQAIGNRVGMPVIDQTEPPEEIRIPYRHHRSAYLSRIEDPTEKVEKLILLLDNLSRQTNLQFTVEHRSVEIWFVTKENKEK